MANGCLRNGAEDATRSIRIRPVRGYERCMGRKAGSISSFRYSAALKSARFTWDDVLLDKWLTDPDSLIAENEMDFSVPKADERAAIIRFLRLSSGK